MRFRKQGEAADGDWRELCEVPRCPLWRGPRSHCPVYHVSCILYLLQNTSLFFTVHGWIPSGLTPYFPRVPVPSRSFSLPLPIQAPFQYKMEHCLKVSLRSVRSTDKNAEEVFPSSCVWQARLMNCGTFCSIPVTLQKRYPFLLEKQITFFFIEFPLAGIAIKPTVTHRQSGSHVVPSHLIH